MKTIIVGILLAAFASAASPLAQRGAESAVSNGAAERTRVAANIRFLAVDLIIDSKDHALAVYQLEFSASRGVSIVGIEGGDHDAFRDPPYYDPSAIQRERVIVAAFSTAAAQKLPYGKTRVATIHLQVTGDDEPRFEVKPAVIATVDGKPIDATATVETKRTQS